MQRTQAERDARAPGVRGALCTLALLVSLTGPAAAAPARPLLSLLFQDHAVLQRGRPINVWGWSVPGDEVTVSLETVSRTTHTDGTGRWSVNLPPLPAGGPHALDVHARSGLSQIIHDVLIGDVWLCSGQSNMVLQVHRTLNSREEIATADNDTIRMLTLPLESSPTPLDSLSSSAQWQPVTPLTVRDFSAACYYYARELQKTLHVPMGLLTSAWGGSVIQAWMSERALHDAGGYDSALELLHLHTSEPVAANRRWGATWETWWRTHASTQPGREPWSESAAAGGAWRAAPRGLGYWENWGVPELARYDGIVWYRTTVRLDAAQARQATELSLGTIDEIDETWLNGQPIGYTSGPDVPRRYPLARGAVHAGINTIAIAVLDTYGFGGIYGPQGQRAVRLADGSSVALDGEWRYLIAPPHMGAPPRAPWESTGGLTTIHNAMIAPLVPYGLRGVLWYQGESNTDDPTSYNGLLHALMADWRRQFSSELPFLIIQLASYGAAATAPDDSHWAALREAQRLAVAGDPQAALIVTIDIGDRYDIHPANKQELGRRAARAARHLIYGEPVTASGPAPLSAEREGGKIVVRFTGLTGALQVFGAKRPVGFELCGTAVDSCRFVDADARDDRVWLVPDAGTTPVHVRFLWADSPTVNLYDASGLPVGPFQIDIQTERSPRGARSGH
jgi:sialate O-acetylesterase